jgi:transcriptional regulator with XRE-family HTH domain
MIMDKEIEAKVEKKFKEKSDLIRSRLILLNFKKGIKQKDIARILGKTPPEISKWMSGHHNLTLRSIIMLEVALEADIIEIEKYDYGRSLKK